MTNTSKYAGLVDSTPAICFCPGHGIVPTGGQGREFVNVEEDMPLNVASICIWPCWPTESNGNCTKAVFGAAGPEHWPRATDSGEAVLLDTANDSGDAAKGVLLDAARAKPGP